MSVARRCVFETAHPLQETEDALCREIFFAFSRAQKALLRMTTAQTSLEEIFLELTAEAPVVQLTAEGQRQDGEEAEG